MGMNAIEIRLAHLEGAHEQIDRRLGAIEHRLEAFDGRFIDVEGRFSNMEGGFTDMDRRFGDLDRKIHSAFFRLVTLVLGSWATLMLGILEILFGHRS